VNDKRVRNISVNASPLIRAEEGKTTTMQVGTTLTYDTRDNRFLPTEGFVLSGTVAYGAPPGSLHFVKGIVRGAVHYTVIPGIVVSLSAGGHRQQHRRSARAPPTARFFWAAIHCAPSASAASVLATQ
jgi:outer membrane protein assembly factor BamA